MSLESSSLNEALCLLYLDKIIIIIIIIIIINFF